MRKLWLLALLLMLPCAARAEGALTAHMGREVYPVGAAYLDFALESPEGICFYRVPGGIDMKIIGDWGVERWETVAQAYDYCGGDPFYEREARESGLRGLMGSQIELMLPLDRIAPLEAGEYRLCYDEDDGEAQYVEFTVSADAEPLPEYVAPAPEPFVMPEHVPAHMSADYVSCLDVSQWARENAALLQIGDAVYVWKGLYESEGSWFPDLWWLFRYPAGHPEEARTMLSRVEIPMGVIIDTGAGWLAEELGWGFCRMDYDGQNRVKVEGLDDARNLLPAGGWLYFTRANGVWRAPLDTLVPEQIYAAEPKPEADEDVGDWEDWESLLHTRADKDVTMVYANGTLYVADSGIVAIDARTLEARRLTDRLYNEAGDVGYAFFVLGDRLYTCLDRSEGMVSMNRDGSDVRPVASEVYYVIQIWNGTVLAARGRDASGFYTGYARIDFYIPNDPLNPTFDPEHCETQAVERYDFMLGDWLYHERADRSVDVRRANMENRRIPAMP